MISVSQLINELRSKNIKLWVEGDKLKYQTEDEAITEDVLNLLRKYKEDIIQFIHTNGVTKDKFIKVSRSSRQPLSFSQQRLWFVEKLNDDHSPAYNAPMVLTMKGELNLPALQLALMKIIERHESLRTRFVEEKGEPWQVLEAPFPVMIEQETVEFEKLHERIDQIVAVPINLGHFPLLNFKLLKVTKKTNVLIINQHHIITDGWSVNIFLKELAALYNACVTGEEAELPINSLHYMDYAVWQKKYWQSTQYDNQIQYWKNKLDNVSTLNLHGSHARPIHVSYNGDSYSFKIDETLWGSIKNLAKQEKVTDFMFMLAAYKLLLKFYSFNNDIAIGTPVANRDHMEFQDSIGIYINTVVLRSDLSGAPTFRQVLEQVKKTCIQAYAKQEVPFEKIVEELSVERELNRHPLFQVMFVMRNKNEFEIPVFKNLSVQLIDPKIDIAKFDLTLYITDKPAGFDCSLEFSTDLFDQDTIAQMGKHFLQLLEGIVMHPEQDINNHNRLTVVEKKSEVEKEFEPEKKNIIISDKYVAPASNMEQKLAAIWCEVLQCKKVSVISKFFRLGGNSLLSIQVIARIQSMLNYIVPVRLMFEYPTIRGLAEYLENNHAKLTQPNNSAIVPADRHQPLPLSFSQQRLWFLDQYEAGNISHYNMPLAICLRGSLNIEALESSVNILINRHESLRTIFKNQQGEAIQVVIPFSKIQLSVEAITQQDLEPTLLVEAQHPFDLTHGPLFRIRLFQLDNRQYVLMLNQHHIISDGLSLAIFIDELTKLYNAMVKGDDYDLIPLNIHYADYAVWQRSDLFIQKLEKDATYWKKQLMGFANLDLPTDFPRPCVKTHSGSYYLFQLESKLVQRITQLTTSTDTTLFMFLLATFNILLSRYSQQEDIVIGTPIANRGVKELEKIIGFFVNTLALRTNVNGTQNFLELLNNVKTVCLDAYSHQSLPFEKLIDLLSLERDVSRDPVFQVMLVLQDKKDVALPDLYQLDTEIINLKTNTAKFDLSLNVMEVGNQLYCSFEYNTDLFTESTIIRLAEHWKILLSEIISQPERKISDYNLLSTIEQDRLLTQWNNTVAEFPHDKTIHELFCEQAKRTPDEVAIMFADQKLTYQELDERSNQVAHYLINSQPGERTGDWFIGICMKRSLELLVGILGILKAGAAYVPLDPEYPSERLSFMLNDLKLDLVISQQDIDVDTMKVFNRQKIIYLDSEWKNIKDFDSKSLPIRSRPEDLIYIIYTSGSTGVPKGTLLEHLGIVNRLHWMQKKYPLNTKDIVLQKTPYSFDVSVWELFWPILVGAKIYFAEPDGHKDPSYLQQIIRQKKITTLHFVPSMLQTFLQESSKDLSSLQQVFCSGEALPTELVQRFYHRFPHCKLHNLYGPTEASVDVSYLDCSTYANSRLPIQPIGKPIDNIQIYILDKYLQLVPQGIAGELYIAGVGLARGYLNRPELTAERFIKNPLLKTADKATGKFLRLYKTGDLARWLEDGNIEYLGRMDDQVKLRGFRIELDEIAAVLSQHELLTQVVLAVKENEQGTKQLVAYFTSKQSDHHNLNVDTLRSYLKNKLPDYMIPAYFVLMEKFPLTTSGKVDKKRLPAPNITKLNLESQYIAPETYIEKLLASIWREVLRVDTIGVNDNFFSLGGDSIMSIQVIARARNAGLLITPKQLFISPTIASLAQVASPIDSISVNSINSTTFPLSPLQEGLFFHALYAPQSDQYCSQFQWEYQGDLDVVALKEAWEKIVERHDIFRCRYDWQDMDKPLQIVEPDIDLPWWQLDWSAFSDTEKNKMLQEYVITDRNKAFEFKKPCLMRLHLIKFSKVKHIFIWSYHHILLDGWSLSILQRELESIYLTILENKNVTLPPAPSYSTYIHWLQQQDVLEAKSFWREQLSEMIEPTPLSINKKPIDIHKPIAAVEGINSYYSVEITAQYKAFAKAQNITLNTLLQMAWAIVLAKYSNSCEVVFGSTVSGRSGEIPEIENIVGLLINTLPMRVKINKEKSVLEQLRELHSTIQEANHYSYLTLSDIQKQTQLMRNLPLFYTLFVFQNQPIVQEQVDSNLPAYNVNAVGKTNFPLMLVVEPGDKLHVELAYDSDCFDKSAMQRLIQHLQNVLTWIVTHPDHSAAESEILCEEEKQQLLTGWNKTETYYPENKTIVDLLTEHAAKTPEKIAVVFDAQRLSYKEFHAQTNKLAYAIREQVGKVTQEEFKVETILAVYGDRSLEFFSAMLGIFKAGGVYLPLDRKYPTKRLVQIFSQSSVKFVLTTKACAAELEAHIINLDLPFRLTIFVIEDLLAQDYPSNEVTSMITPDNLAYLMYTSGSTGLPKGAMVEHRGMVNHLFAKVNDIAITADDVIIQNASQCFDVSVFQFSSQFVRGGRVVVINDEIAYDAIQLIDCVSEEGVTLLEVVPSMIRILLDIVTVRSDLRSKLSNLRWLISTGDALLPELCDQWFALYPQIPILNTYGPTECSDDVMHFPVYKTPENKSSIVPIGRPIQNMQMYVLDEQRKPIPVGVLGELYIGGLGVGRGYLNDPQRTAEAFSINPFTNSTVYNRLYKTGDLVRRLEDGTIEFVGRLNSQVKVRGYRVGLGVIETALRQHEAIKECVVILGDHNGEKHLLAYYVLVSPEIELEVETLRQYLKDELPEYMVPSFFMALEKLPLNSNGKVDKKRLPALDYEKLLTQIAQVAPSTETQQILIDVLQSVVNLRNININNSFFELGGDSLQALRYKFKLDKEFQIDLPIAAIFENPTIEMLAECIDRQINMNNMNQVVYEF